MESFVGVRRPSGALPSVPRRARMAVDSSVRASSPDEPFIPAWIARGVSADDPDTSDHRNLTASK